MEAVIQTGSNGNRRWISLDSHFQKTLLVTIEITGQVVELRTGEISVSKNLFHIVLIFICSRYLRKCVDNGHWKSDDTDSNGSRSTVREELRKCWCSLSSANVTGAPASADCTNALSICVYSRPGTRETQSARHPITGDLHWANNGRAR